MQTDKILSALIGLAGACSNNPRRENTDSLVIRALAFPWMFSPGGEELVEEIHEEKYAVSPGCRFCEVPCGNTSDYDLRKLYEAPEDIRGMKLAIVLKLREKAAELSRRGESVTQEEMEGIYKALSYIGYDVGMESLQDVWEEL